jgi:hypothetical protein
VRVLVNVIVWVTNCVGLGEPVRVGNSEADCDHVSVGECVSVADVVQLFVASDVHVLVPVPECVCVWLCVGEGVGDVVWENVLVGDGELVTVVLGVMDGVIVCEGVRDNVSVAE